MNRHRTRRIARSCGRAKYAKIEEERVGGIEKFLVSSFPAQAGNACLSDLPTSI
jgi:hypothetical protein